jgi:hypothetical protein
VASRYTYMYVHSPSFNQDSHIIMEKLVALAAYAPCCVIFKLCLVNLGWRSKWAGALDYFSNAIQLNAYTHTCLYLEVGSKQTVSTSEELIW